MCDTMSKSQLFAFCHRLSNIYTTLVKLKKKIPTVKENIYQSVCYRGSSVPNLISFLSTSDLFLSPNENFMLASSSKPLYLVYLASFSLSTQETSLSSSVSLPFCFPPKACISHTKHTHSLSPLVDYIALQGMDSFCLLSFISPVFSIVPGIIE